MRETYTPVLLRRKTIRLRNSYRNQVLHGQYDQKSSPLTSLRHSIVRLTKMPLLSPICSALATYNAFVWDLLVLLFTTFADAYAKEYGGS